MHLVRCKNSVFRLILIITQCGLIKPNERAEIEARIQAIKDEEARTARLFAAGKISEEVWEGMWTEWLDRRRRLESSLSAMDRQYEHHIVNLDSALEIIAKVGLLYNSLTRSDQKELLRLMVERVVVNPEGKVRLELRAPFGYLHDISERMRRSELDQTNKNTSQDTSAGARSDAVPGIGQ